MLELIFMLQSRVVVEFITEFVIVDGLNQLVFCFLGCVLFIIVNKSALLSTCIVELYISLAVSVVLIG